MFPPCMVGVMLVMVTSFKVLMSVLLYSVPLTPCQAIVEPTSLLETPGHSQASLTWSLVRSLLLSPGSWCAQGFVCALQESFPPVLWKFCNQIPLAFKVKFTGGFQSLCWVPRLGNVLWILELCNRVRTLV